MGLLVGTVAGVVSGARGWPPGRSFAAALGLYVLALSVPEIAAMLDFPSTLVAIVLGPLIACFPPGAGFLVGRRMGEALRRRE